MVSLLQYSRDCFRSVWESSFVNKLTDPGLLKKGGHIIRKGFIAWEWDSEPRFTPAVKGLKLFGDCLDFYGSYQNLKEWKTTLFSNFSEKTLDRQQLEKSMKAAFLASQAFKDTFIKQDGSNLENAPTTEIKIIVENILSELEKNEKITYKSVDDVKDKLIEVINAMDGFKGNDACLNLSTTIINRLTVQKKSKSPILLAMDACFTVADLGDNLITLKNWGVFELAGNAVRIGTASQVYKTAQVAIVGFIKCDIFAHANRAFSIGKTLPVFAFVSFAVLETAVTAFSCVGLTVGIGVSTYDGIRAIQKICDKNTTSKEKTQAKKDLKRSAILVAGSSVSLVCMVIPLVIAVNPFASIVVLHVISKGTGVILTFLK